MNNPDPETVRAAFSNTKDARRAAERLAVPLGTLDREILVQVAETAVRHHDRGLIELTGRILERSCRLRRQAGNQKGN